MILTHAKVVSCCNRHPKNDFIPLVIEIFGCLHQHVNDFFHHCANMAWSTTTILHWAIVAIGEASSKLGVLPSFSPISLHDLFHVTSDGFRSQVSSFLILRLPIVHFAFFVVIFCLDFSLFLKILSPYHMVFLQIFIYLFEKTNTKNETLLSYDIQLFPIFWSSHHLWPNTFTL